MSTQHKDGSAGRNNITSIIPHTGTLPSMPSATLKPQLLSFSPDLFSSRYGRLRGRNSSVLYVWGGGVTPPMAGPQLAGGCGALGPRRCRARNLGVTHTSARMTFPERVRGRPRIKSYGGNIAAEREAWEGTKRRKGNQRFSHWHQEKSFKGGSGYPCQVILAKRSSKRRPEKCLEAYHHVGAGGPGKNSFSGVWEQKAGPTHCPPP